MSQGLQGVSCSFQPLSTARFDEEHDDRYVSAYNWNYMKRDARSQPWHECQFVGLWPNSRFCAGDPTSPLTCLGDDASSINWDSAFEETSLGLSGYSRPYFLRGVTQNVSGVPMIGVTVSGFVTAGNVFAGTIVSDNQGNYACPTFFPGVAHYLVAFYGSNPDMTGMSDTTLIPAL